MLLAAWALAGYASRGSRAPLGDALSRAMVMHGSRRWPVFLVTLVGMEGVAYLMHKHLMHGPLWVLHESHHRPRGGWFEANDLFGIFFSVPSIVSHLPRYPRPTVAARARARHDGLRLLYWGFHDVIVHRRVKLRLHLGGAYLNRIVRAHLVHHKTTTKEGATSFGFLYARRI